MPFSYSFSFKGFCFVATTSRYKFPMKISQHAYAIPVSIVSLNITLYEFSKKNIYIISPYSQSSVSKNRKINWAWVPFPFFYLILRLPRIICRIKAWLGVLQGTHTSTSPREIKYFNNNNNNNNIVFQIRCYQIWAMGFHLSSSRAHGSGWHWYER